jgi:hypothetical protein
MSWFIFGRNYSFGFDGTTTVGGGVSSGYFEPLPINPQSGEEIPTGNEHYLFWNTNGLAAERVTNTADALRLLDVMRAVVLRETWPKNGGGITGVYLWKSAGLSQNGAGLSGVERAGIAVDENGPYVGTSGYTGYYLPNAMTLLTAQPNNPPSAEIKNDIMLFLLKCEAAMLRYSATWTT